MVATPLYRFFAVLTLALSGACASSSTSSDSTYSNFLVLAMTDNYSNRAQYERTVASGLRRLGVQATPYHTAVGGSGDISRERARELIDEQGFDAVLVTQVRQATSAVNVEQDSAAVKVTRKDERPIDFFRYDYEEMDEPGAMTMLAEGRLDTNLHQASDGAIVWSYSWSSKSAENVGILIDNSSADLVKNLDRARLVGN